MDSPTYSEFTSLKKIKLAMSAKGVNRLYVKNLAPNNNSKNQIYLGGNFDVLNVLPFGDITIDLDKKNSKRDRFKAKVNFFWIDSSGQIGNTPNSQLIMYPKYPEVRLGSLLRGCKMAPSKILNDQRQDRLLFLGVNPEGKIFGHITIPENPILKEIEKGDYNQHGVLLEIPLAKNEKGTLLEILREINEREWIDSIRLNSAGDTLPCKASNCGGYTLEALMGIKPNGYAEPDFLGWEVKQYGILNLEKPLSSKPITLMTPEPTGGIYKEKGAHYFMRTYGYPDMHGRPDRINFGGVYKVGRLVPITNLTTALIGFDLPTGKLTDINGSLAMLDKHGNHAASWSFSSLLTLWNRKHAKAVYIPSNTRKQPTQQYRYGNLINLGEGTDFIKFIDALAKGAIYLDPALKLEGVSTNAPKIKKRNQFRINARELSTLYHSFYSVDLQEKR